MTPGIILHDSRFICHDGTQNNKLLVVLSDGSSGSYILVKTTSSSVNKTSSPGCHPKDQFMNFFIPQGDADFPKDTWVMLNEFYEANINELFERKSKGHLNVKGSLSTTMVKALLICAMHSLDITPNQEKVLDETLTKLALL